MMPKPPTFVVPQRQTFNPARPAPTNIARIGRVPIGSALKPYQMGYNANGTKKGAKELRFL